MNIDDVEKMFRRVLNESNKTTEQIDKSWKDIGKDLADIWGFSGKAVKDFAKKAGSAMIDVGKDIFKTGVDYNQTLENSLAYWTTMTGSLEEARKKQAEIQQLALQTNFDYKGTDELTKVFERLGIGGDQLAKNVNAIDDALSAMGKAGDTNAMMGVANAISQIAGKGKLSAEEMNQLANQGIEGWQLMARSQLKAKGVLEPTTKQLNDQVIALRGQAKAGISSDEAIKLLIDGMELYKGAGDEMAGTMQGLKGKLEDLKQIFSGQIVEPFFDAIARLMMPLVNAGEEILNLQALGKDLFTGDAFSGSDNPFLKFFDSIAPTLANINDLFWTTVAVAQEMWKDLYRDDVAKMFQSAMDGLAKVFGFLSDNMHLILPAIPVIMKFLLAKSVVNKFKESFGKLDDILKATTGTFEKLAGLGKMGWIKIAITAIALLVKYFMNLYKTNESFKEAVDKLWASFKEGLKICKDFISNALQKMGEWFDKVKDKANKVKESFQNFSNNISDKFNGAIDSAKEKLQNLRDGFQTIIEVIKNKLAPVFEFLSNLMNFLSVLFVNTAKIITIILVESFKWLVENIKPVIERLKEVYEIIKNKVISVFEDFNKKLDVIREVFAIVADAIKQYLIDRFNQVKERVELVISIFQDIWAYIMEKLTPVFEFFSGIIDKVKETFTNLYETIRDSVITIFESIMDKISLFIEIGKLCASFIIDKLIIAFNWWYDIAKTVWGAIADLIKIIVEKFLSILENTKTKIMEVIDRFREFGNKIKEYVMDKIKATIEVIQKIVDKFNYFKDKIKIYGIDQLEKLGAKFDWVSGIVDKFKRKIDELVRKFQESRIGQLVGEIGDAWNKLAGRSITIDTDLNNENNPLGTFSYQGSGLGRNASGLLSPDIGALRTFANSSVRNLGESTNENGTGNNYYNVNVSIEAKGLSLENSSERSKIAGMLAKDMDRALFNRMQSNKLGRGMV